MKKIILVAVCVLINIYLFANDGTYLVKGSILYPTNETSISIEKEILSFDVRDRKAVVNIYFEFFNPDSVNRNLTVGFQAPSYHHDAGIEGPKPKIKDFKIQFENKLLPYKITSANCEDCELKYKSEEDFLNTNGIFVYLFEVSFKPGINKIYHSYEFPASRSVIYDQIYNYILKTGGKWADGTIKDFTLNIDIGKNKYFYINDIFGENAIWNIIGTGRISDFNKFSNKYIRIISGILQVNVSNFKPTSNLEFGIKSSKTVTIYRLQNEIFSDKLSNALECLAGSTEGCKRYFDRIIYSEEELRILRNVVYAQYGYKFKDEELLKYFNQFDWYFPDPHLEIEKITLTQNEDEFIKMIQERESELKKSE
ncbi:MAG: YARHG domain-containing protein [Patescibacteria group bacterium]|jgi:hypothetical protein|nr:YARHG domain-containing protein [Patescibacteria group bacterium]